MRTRALRALAGALVAIAFAASPAAADQRIEAGPGTQYLTTSVTMAQGERLTFLNLDVTGHDVTARKTGSGAKPLFGTPVIGTGSSAFVDGSQYLTTGSYQYYCSVHPFMQGTLTVTSAGKPATPPPGSDRHAPAIAVEIVSGKLGGVQSSGKLKVSFHTDEAASVDLHGSVQVGQHTYVLGKASRTVQGNRPTSVSLTLSSKARQAVQKASKAVFKVGARTRDAAGNRGSGAAKRTLRR